LFTSSFPLSKGGGVALLYASQELDKIITSNNDEKMGVDIIKNALKVLTIFLTKMNFYVADTT
jgi:chaperonin GroEL (HSP60 family)